MVRSRRWVGGHLEGAGRRRAFRPLASAIIGLPGRVAKAQGAPRKAKRKLKKIDSHTAGGGVAGREVYTNPRPRRSNVA